MSKWWEKYLLVPFKDEGRSMLGADCLGLVQMIFAEYGINLPDFKIACHASMGVNSEIEKQLSEHWEKTESPGAPGLVVMATDPQLPKLSTHLGAYIGNGFFIHTMEKIGASRTALDHPYFGNRIKGFYVLR